jgi:hypothetical protein
MEQTILEVLQWVDATKKAARLLDGSILFLVLLIHLKEAWTRVVHKRNTGESQTEDPDVRS